MDREATLAALRERISAIEGSRVEVGRQPSGWPEFDRCIGGLPVPGIIELSGPVGSGRTRVALRWVAAVTQASRSVAWVDGRRRLYPPGAAAWGVELSRLLVVQPDSTQESWAIDQVLRSGIFPLVVAADPADAMRGSVGQRWAHAAEAGRCTLVVLSSRSLRGLPASVRLAVDGESLIVLHHRHGNTGRIPLPIPPAEANPWR